MARLIWCSTSRTENQFVHIRWPYAFLTHKARRSDDLGIIQNNKKYVIFEQENINTQYITNINVDNPRDENVHVWYL